MNSWLEEKNPKVGEYCEKVNMLSKEEEEGGGEEEVDPVNFYIQKVINSHALFPIHSHMELYCCGMTPAAQTIHNSQSIHVGVYSLALLERLWMMQLHTNIHRMKSFLLSNSVNSSYLLHYCFTMITYKIQLSQCSI